MVLIFIRRLGSKTQNSGSLCIHWRSHSNFLVNFSPSVFVFLLKWYSLLLTFLIPCCKGASIFKTPGSSAEWGFASCSGSRAGKHQEATSVRVEQRETCKIFRCEEVLRNFPSQTHASSKETQAGKMKFKPEGEIHVTVWNVWKGFLCLFSLFFFLNKPWLSAFSAALIVRELGEATWDELHRGWSLHPVYFHFSFNLRQPFD